MWEQYFVLWLENSSSLVDVNIRDTYAACFQNILELFCKQNHVFPAVPSDRFCPYLQEKWRAVAMIELYVLINQLRQ